MIAKLGNCSQNSPPILRPIPHDESLLARRGFAHELMPAQKLGELQLAGSTRESAEAAGGELAGGLSHSQPFTHTTWCKVCTISTRSDCAAITASISL